jgi:cobyrinic acid a,c-diamide synthase
VTETTVKRPLVIAGVASGVGKTTVAAGLMGAFRQQGYSVAPFKVGPDYIDPGFHLEASGAVSRNLDTWLTDAAAVKQIFARGSAGAQVSIIEGVMGLFDGRAGAYGQGSTAEVAELTGGAVVLVADCARQARSLAPVLDGFSRFDPDLPVAGVILNNVGSPSHGRMLREAAREVGVPVLGILPRRGDIGLPSRHLGLVPAQEQPEENEALQAIIAHVAENVYLDSLLALSREEIGPEVPVATAAGADRRRGVPDIRARIAVARDEAFSFYYVDSMEALEDAGAELVYFSPIRDTEVPVCDGLYLGGGFPEMFADRLEENAGMRRSVAAAVAGGLPAYAECGGLVYLCRGIEVDGGRREMVGAVPLEARMTGRRQALGYVEAKARGRNLLLPAGGRIRGHQFHWSAIEWDDACLAYDCYSSRFPGVESDGYSHGRLLASYVHIHFVGNPGAATSFVNACARTRGAANNV